MNCEGWSHHMSFWAFKHQQFGTKRIAVGQADKPHLCMFNLDHHQQRHWNDYQNLMSVCGWSHFQGFWAYETQHPGTIRISAAQAHGPHRSMVNHSDYNQSHWNDGNSMTMQGWSHFVEFWVFPDPHRLA